MNFKTINEDDLTNFTSKNTDKDIYLISWGNPDTNLDTKKVLKEQGVVISKVKPQIDEDYYQLY